MPLRMMAAKALVPLSPVDMVGALYLLSYDPDAGVREATTKSALGLPDKILGTLRDEAIKPPILGFFLDLLWQREDIAEMLVLNGATPDEAVANAVGRCSARLAETIGQNQLRILRHDDVIRQLCRNANASPRSIGQGVYDFLAVRSGLVLMDVLADARDRAGATVRPPGGGSAAGPGPDCGPR